MEKDMVRANKVVSTTSDLGADHDPSQLALVEASDDFESGSVVRFVSQYCLPGQRPNLGLQRFLACLQESVHYARECTSTARLIKKIDSEQMTNFSPALLIA